MATPFPAAPLHRLWTQSRSGDTWPLPISPLPTLSPGPGCTLLGPRGGRPCHADVTQPRSGQEGYSDLDKDNASASAVLSPVSATVSLSCVLLFT